MSKKSDRPTDRKDLEIRVVVLKNKETGEVVRLLPPSYVAQSWKYPEDKWVLIGTAKLDLDVFK